MGSEKVTCGCSSTDVATTPAGGGYIVLTTQNTVKWAITKTRIDATAMERIVQTSMFVCSPSFVETKHTAMNDAVVDAQIDGLYRLIKGRINWDNVVPTCMEVARELENMTHLRGAERLDLLQKTLKLALKESDVSIDEKEGYLYVIEKIVPVVMQAAVLASKSPIVAQVTSFCGICWKK